MVKSITNSLNPVRSRGPHDHQTYAMCSGGENVAVAVGVGESVGVADGVGENVGVADGVGESVGVADGVGESVGVVVGVGESVGVADGMGENVAVAVGVGESVGVAEWARVWESWTGQSKQLRTTESQVREEPWYGSCYTNLGKRDRKVSSDVLMIYP